MERHASVGSAACLEMPPAEYALFVAAAAVVLVVVLVEKQR